MKFLSHDGLHLVLGQLVLLDPDDDFLPLKKIWLNSANKIELLICGIHIIYTHFMSVLEISCYLSIGSIVQEDDTDTS